MSISLTTEFDIHTDLITMKNCVHIGFSELKCLLGSQQLLRNHECESKKLP